MTAADAHLTQFDLHLRTRVVFGSGAIAQAGHLTRELGITRALLVTDPGIVAAGHAERVQKGLAAAQVQTFLFADVIENPTTVEAQACTEFARAQRIDGIIGLGGGSALDTAKACNFLLTNGGKMQDYWGVGKAKLPMLPLMAIPTTAGTGSECQSFALIADAVTHQKMACGDVKAAPRIALLDPELTLTQPPLVTACTGIDALAHALESVVTRRRNPVSSLFSQQAFFLLSTHLPVVLERPHDLAARAAVQLGAAYGGLAIENSMLGAAHAAANPLTAHFGVVHGHAVGLMLPQVIQYNAQDQTVAGIYGHLVSQGNGRVAPHPQEPASALAQLVVTLLRRAGLPTTLGELGIPTERIPDLAQEAAQQWTAGFNPRPVSADDFAALYQQAWAGAW